MNKKISIIIPHYNSEQTLRNCLKSILSQTETFHEIIIIDDNSSNTNLNNINNPKIKIIKLNIRKGPASCRNIGAKKASGEIFLFIDADVIFQKNTLKKIKVYYQTNNNLLQGVYTAQTNSKKTVTIYKNIYHYYKFFRIRGKQLNSLSSFCFAISRKTYLLLNGFDENYKYCKGGEDIDFGYRAIENGHSITLNKTIQVKHLKEFGLLDLILSDFRKNKSAFKIFIRKFSKNKFKTPIKDFPVSKNKLSGMLHILLSILICPIILIMGILSFSNTILINYIAALFVIFIVLNFGFFITILKINNKIIFNAIFIHYLVILSAGIAMFCGVIEYFLFKDRY